MLSVALRCFPREWSNGTGPFSISSLLSKARYMRHIILPSEYPRFHCFSRLTEGTKHSGKCFRKMTLACDSHVSRFQVC